MSVLISLNCMYWLTSLFRRWTTTTSHGNGAAARNNNQPAGSATGSGGTGATTTRAPTRHRGGRVVRTVGGARGRGTSGVIVGRPLIPANVVPEDLISQCQVVLQGKSRNLIVRELQRTVRNYFGNVFNKSTKQNRLICEKVGGANDMSRWGNRPPLHPACGQPCAFSWQTMLSWPRELHLQNHFF